MSRRKIDPLRELTEPERRELEQLARSQVAPAVEASRAKILLAVADGHDYQHAARSVGRRSGDAVAHLVARFNAEGTAALTPRHTTIVRPSCQRRQLASHPASGSAAGAGIAAKISPSSRLSQGCRTALGQAVTPFKRTCPSAGRNSVRALAVPSRRYSCGCRAGSPSGRYDCPA